MDGTERLEKIVSYCNHCGLCIANCPTIAVKKLESWGPRGRILLAKNFFKGGIEQDAGSFTATLYSCLLCGGCRKNCPCNVEVPEAMIYARTIYASSNVPPGEVLDIKSRIEKNGNLFDTSLGRSDNESIEKGELLLFRGCRATTIEDDLISTEKLLKTAGYNFFEMSPEICCGYPLEVLGFREEAEIHYKKCLKKFLDAGIKKIITVCPSCFRALNEFYPRVVGDHGIKIVHITNVLKELVEEGSITPVKGISLKVSMQDPCQLSDSNSHSEIFRDILHRIPALQVLEPERIGIENECCGGPVSRLVFPQIHKTITERRLKAFYEKGCHVIITSSPQCLMALREASKGKPVAVEGLSKILAISAGIL